MKNTANNSTKGCTNKNCSQENPQPLTHFHKSTQHISGLRNECKSCRATYTKKYRLTHRDKMRRKNVEWSRKNPRKTQNTFYQSNYGITLEQYEEMIKDREGKCDLCHKIPKTKLCVDHDHELNTIRGLLCRSCNGALGVFGDSLKGIQNAVDYLRRIEYEKTG